MDKIKVLCSRDKLNNVQKFMDSTNIYITEYDDTLVRKLIIKVVTMSESKMNICFQNGTVVKEVIVLQ